MGGSVSITVGVRPQGKSKALKDKECSYVPRR